MDKRLNAKQYLRLGILFLYYISVSHALCVNELNECMKPLADHLSGRSTVAPYAYLDIVTHGQVCSGLPDLDDPIYTGISICLSDLKTGGCPIEDVLDVQAMEVMLEDIIMNAYFCGGQNCYVDFQELNACASRYGTEITLNNFQSIPDSKCALPITSPSEKWSQTKECVQLESNECDIVRQVINGQVDNKPYILPTLTSHGLALTDALALSNQCSNGMLACFIEIQACYNMQDGLDLYGLDTDTSRLSTCNEFASEMKAEIEECIVNIPTRIPSILCSTEPSKYIFMASICADTACENANYTDNLAMDECITESPSLEIVRPQAQNWPNPSSDYCRKLMGVLSCLNEQLGGECSTVRSFLMRALSPSQSTLVDQLDLANIRTEDIVHIQDCEASAACVEANQCVFNIRSGITYIYILNKWKIYSERRQVCDALEELEDVGYVTVYRDKLLPKNIECITDKKSGCYREGEHDKLLTDIQYLRWYCEDDCEDAQTRLEAVNRCLNESGWTTISNIAGVSPTSSRCQEAPAVAACVVSAGSGCRFVNELVNATIVGVYSFDVSAVHASAAIFKECNYEVPFENAAGIMTISRLLVTMTGLILLLRHI